MVAAPIEHICLDERGVAYIRGTRMKIQHIAIDSVTWKMTPEEIQEAYPHLSLAQIYAALAYYHDHKEQVDAEIAESVRYAEAMRAQYPNPLTREQFEERRHEKEQTA